MTAVTPKITKLDKLTWGLRDRTPGDIPVGAAGASWADPDWAFGGSTGAGVRVCVVDSGVQRDHPLVGQVTASYVVTDTPDGTEVVETEADDRCGHGTACAGIIRELAPDCELYSVRVLGDGFSGSGAHLIAGLRWAVHQGFDVINMSLSTTKTKFVEELRQLADLAYFGRTAIVAAAHNTAVESFPWRFSSVISVGSHGEAERDMHLYNPVPPVEFFAMGQNVRVAWPDGISMPVTGNSFATPWIAGRCAQALAKHPELTVFQLKTLLYLTAANVHAAK